MPKQKSRIIVDTNLWISILLTQDYLKFDSLLDDQNITLLFNEELLNELIEVSRRPKFKRYFDKEDVEELLSIINRMADFTEVTTEVNICRDPNDNFLLALAIDGKADYLITGDSDLLVIKKIDKTDIVTMAEYISTL